MKRKFLLDTWRKEPAFLALCAAIRTAKTQDELADVLGDLLTIGELQEVSERLEIAKLLGQGLSYRQVAARARVSTTTVTRVARAIENGTGGLRRILKVHRHYRDEKMEQPRPQIRTEPQLKPHVRPLQRYLAQHETRAREQG